jgi:DNA uptake protein ComE-like DNA-binding protein
MVKTMNGFRCDRLGWAGVRSRLFPESTQQRAYDRFHDVARPRDERPRDTRADLNGASQATLARLPGLSTEDAARIVANRPYGNVSGLLRKNVLGQRKYEGIRDYVYVTK